MARKAKVSRMAEVAKMLGVEYDKAFKIKEDTLGIYKIVEDGLIQYDRERDCWNLAPRMLTEILAGYVKPVWKPTKGEKYYVSDFCNRDLWECCLWDDEECDEELYEKGVVFKTKEEAIEMAKKMLAVAKEAKDNG